MGEVVVWWVRFVFSIIVVGALALTAALFLLICDVGVDLRGLLGVFAIWCFYALLFLVVGMGVFSVGNKMTRRLRNWLHSCR